MTELVIMKDLKRAIRVIRRLGEKGYGFLLTTLAQGVPPWLL